MTAEQLAMALRNDDFLYVKWGGAKPLYAKCIIKYLIPGLSGRQLLSGKWLKNILEPGLANLAFLGSISSPPWRPRIPCRS